MLFGAEPPLYSKPPGYVAPPTAASQGPSSNPYAGFSQQQQSHTQPGVQQQQLGGYPSAAVAQQQQQPDSGLASHSIWGAAYAAVTGSGGRPAAGPAPASGPAIATSGPNSSLGYGVQQTPPPPPIDPKQQQKEELNANFQVRCAAQIVVTVSSVYQRARIGWVELCGLEYT